ncbi:MFS transporter [bacterium]|nr:MAG: MFS transporter [bacterium]
MKRSPLLVVFITVFIDLVSFGIVIPLLPFYAQNFGASGVVIGLLLSVFSLMSFVFMPLWGRLSDRYGRRPILLITIGGSFIAYLIFSAAFSLWMLFLSRILAGIANANISVAQAYISDVTTVENRSKGMGMIGAAFGLGFIFGPLISGVFSADYFGDMKYALPGYIAAGLCLLNFISAYFLLPESLHADLRTTQSDKALIDVKALHRALQTPQLGLIILLLFIATVAFSNIYASFPLFIMEEPFKLSTSGMGWFFAEIGVFSVIVQGGLIGRLTKLFGERNLVFGGATMMCMGFIGFPISSALPVGGLISLGFFVALLAVGSSCMTPTIMSLSSQLADPKEQGSILGIIQSFASLARMLGPAIGGVAYDFAGHDMPYYVAFVLMLFSVGIAATLLRRHGSRI